MICGYCGMTDGLNYITNPPVVRCKFTNEVHRCGEQCNITLVMYRSGYWIGVEGNSAKCSECGEIVSGIEEARYIYCPYCGAHNGSQIMKSYYKKANKCTGCGFASTCTDEEQHMCFGEEDD